MKFAHLSDCHVGGWREEELKALSIEAFTRATDICKKEGVDFIIIAGDLFNNSLPAIEALKDVTTALKSMKDSNIPVYCVPGSHDFSPSNKTMLDVLENAGLLINVYKFVNNKLSITIDQKTRTKITGMCGLRGSLEKLQYATLLKDELEKEDGFKIFVFHTLLNELKPKQFEEIEGEPLASLPKNFNYYAGGHPHFVYSTDRQGYGKIAYPGPLFPNNFKELEDLHHGGFYIVDEKLSMKRIPIELKKVIKFDFSAEKKTPQQLKEDILKALASSDCADKIILMRISGALSVGKPSDIDLNNIVASVKHAYCVLRNTAKLTSKEFEEQPIEAASVEGIEEKVIKDHLGQIKFKDLDKDQELVLVQNMMNIFNKEKDEGERNADFEARITKDAVKLFHLEDVW